MRTPETLRYSEYMHGSDGIPVNPLKPCAGPVQTILSGGVPMHPVDKYLNQKGAAASPPLRLGVSIQLRVHWDPPPERMVCPGAAQVSRGSIGIPSEPGIHPEFRKVSGVRILQL